MKKKVTNKNISRKPKVGDTVFKKDDSTLRKWNYRANIYLNSKNMAYITSSQLKFIDGDVEETVGLIDYVNIDLLTLTPPPGSPEKISIF